MAIQYAAHVGCPIAHGSDVATLGLSIAGIVIATIVVVASEGTALLAFGPAMEAGGTIAVGGKVGMIAGRQADRLMPESEAEGLIGTGLESVLLGSYIKPAARAMSEETKTKKCHVEMMAEGSDTVMLGVDTKPMSRVGDRVWTGCGGKVSDGCHSIWVGGTPTQQGREWEEQDSFQVAVLSRTLDFAGGATLAARGDVGSVIRGTAQAASVVMPNEVASVVKAASTPLPANPLEAIDTVNTYREGTVAATRIITGGEGGREGGEGGREGGRHE